MEQALQYRIGWLKSIGKGSAFGRSPPFGVAADQWAGVLILEARSLAGTGESACSLNKFLFSGTL